jgi:hypothetical protein
LAYTVFTMKHTPRLTLAALIATAAISLLGTSAQASPGLPILSASQSSASSKPKKPKALKQAKANKGTSVVFYDGSGETRAERDRRLTRECRGRPNAGLCEGYAQP